MSNIWAEFGEKTVVADISVDADGIQHLSASFSYLFDAVAQTLL